MMQDITGGISRDGNLLGYVDHKNPLIFQDSFDSGIRSAEWSKYVNSGSWQDYIQAVNGQARFQLTGTGAITVAMSYPLPGGNWELNCWMSGVVSANQTLKQYLALRQDAAVHYRIRLMLIPPSNYYTQLYDHNWSLQWSSTDHTPSTWRIRFQDGNLYFYRKPDGGSESLIYSTPSQIGLNDCYLYLEGSSGGVGACYFDDFQLKRLNQPQVYHMKPVHSYTRMEYSGRLLLGYLGRSPLSQYLLRNEGRVSKGGYEYSGLASYSNCTWSSKDGYAAMYFNGTNSVIRSDIYAHPGGMVSDKFTITAWAYIDPATSSESLILGKTSASTANDYAVILTAPSKGIQVRINTDTRAQFNNAWQFNRWHHIAVTYDCTLPSNQINAYVDGVLAGQQSGYTTAVTANLKPIFIGSMNGVAGQLKGYLRNVRLHNTALTQEEILDEMQRDYIPPVETYTKELSSITWTEEPPLQVKYY
ncbi:hypothetical protein [Methanobacterium virus PhiF3]|nr:hypothetical protein [Methanobacterium virus PhiF3]